MSAETKKLGGEGFVSLPITDEDFNRLVRFIKSNYGIDLREKRPLIAARLSGVIRQRGFESFSDFVTHLLQTRSEEDINMLLSKLTTNYTFFMREPESLEYFQRTIIPEVVERHKNDKTLSIWSAGCSSGEEPYNITMYLFDYLGVRAKEWDTRILATDISPQALSAAKRGTYRLPATVPNKWREKYFTPNADGSHTVTPEVRQNVLYRPFNLMEPIKFKKKFDVIFCRNVMIYFDQPTKDALVRRFHDATVPNGYFLISCSENLSSTAPYQRVAAATYQRGR